MNKCFGKSMAGPTASDSASGCGDFATACAKRLLLAVLLLTLPGGVQAQYNYVTNSGAITITGYACPNGDGAVTVPSTIHGLPVTNIGDWAFNGCGSLTSVTIPSSVTRIGESAFSGCTSLTSATIPNTVTEMGNGVFSGCTTLIGVTIPDSVARIGESAFVGCASLTSVTIPNSVLNIGGAAFAACRSLPRVTIPNSVTNIDALAFAMCTSLSTVTLGSSVANIGFGAFGRCPSLASITIPNSVTSLSDTAFGSCHSLAAITVEPLNDSYSSVDGVLFDKNRTTLIEFPGGKGGSYSIPGGVTAIGDNGFFDCPGLISVAIPNSVASVGATSFRNCASLTGVYFEGNALTVTPDVFIDSSKTIVYYLPGTTGWAATLGDRPVRLWVPLIQGIRPGLGARTNSFGFTITWGSDRVVVVEASTDLAHPAWFPVQTNTLAGGSFVFNDAQWTNQPSRFYRLRSL